MALRLLCILHLSLGVGIGIVPHSSTLEAGVARGCRVSNASSLSIVGSRLMGHLVDRMLHLVVVVVVVLILLLSLVTSLISKARLGTLLIVVAGVTVASLLLREIRLPLLLLHLTALAL